MSGLDDVPMERWSDDQLLRAAHAGDATAFRVFCVRSLPTLLRHLKWQCELFRLPRDLHKDLAQETVLRALAQAHARAETKQPLPCISLRWMFRIGHNLLVDWFRKNSRQTAAQIHFLENLRAEKPSKEEVEQYEEVLEFFSWLNPKEQEILELTLLNGMSPEAAGRQIGLNKWASYKAYARALQHLRDLIDQHGRVYRRR